MTARQKVQYVVLCEDRQHEVFARRFLKAARVVTNPHKLRIELSPRGRGAADKFVEEHYVKELEAVRRAHVDRCLLVVTDGDTAGVVGRLRRFETACKLQGVAVRSSTDRVAVFVPTWNIETWLAYLDGQAVEEGRKDYPKLGREGECQRHVGALVEMCQRRELREPTPKSLEAACAEYRTRFG